MLSRILGTYPSKGSHLSTPVCHAMTSSTIGPTLLAFHGSFFGWRCRGSRCCGGEHYGATTASSAALSVSKRFVQFEQTSDTLIGVNKNRRALHNRWTTKSTREYMSEADSKTSKGTSGFFAERRERRLERAARKRERAREMVEASDQALELELDRMRDDSGRRWRKGINFFKRQGIAFTLLYIAAYVGTLCILYVGFASGVLPKDKVFEFVFIFLETYIDRDQFFARVEAWDTYTNFGFAFVINEMLEVVRLPVVFFFFFQARLLLTGVKPHAKSSIFRFGAAES